MARERVAWGSCFSDRGMAPPFSEVIVMNWLAIALVALLAIYIVLWSIDRWVVQPRLRAKGLGEPVKKNDPKKHDGPKGPRKDL